MVEKWQESFSWVQGMLLDNDILREALKHYPFDQTAGCEQHDRILGTRGSDPRDRGHSFMRL